MSIKGVYGIAGDSDMPNLGGGLLSLIPYILKQGISFTNCL